MLVLDWNVDCRLMLVYIFQIQVAFCQIHAPLGFHLLKDKKCTMVGNASIMLEFGL